MKFTIKYFIFTVSMGMFSLLNAQYSGWENILNTNYTLSIADDNQSVWIGTEYGGLIEVDKVSGVKTYYNKANSPLGSNTITSITVDNKGNKWFGTYDAGLVKYDGLTWNVYKMNDIAGGNRVNDLEIDSDGNLWVATDGIRKFNGSTWTTYNKDNSGLPTDAVKDIAIDKDGVLWVATTFTLESFDGSVWNCIILLPNTAIKTL